MEHVSLVVKMESIQYTSESYLKLDILNSGQNFPKNIFGLVNELHCHYDTVHIAVFNFRQHRFNRLWNSFYL